MMAAALKRCYDKQTHFRKKISVDEQRAQKDNWFLRGRQIAYLIYGYFRPTGSYDEIQGLSGLCSIKLENDDFSGLWFTLGASIVIDKWSSIGQSFFEGLYVSKLEDSSQAQTIMAPYSQEILRGGGQRDYHRLRMCVKLHIEQAQRSKNFRIQNEITERGAVIRGKGQNPSTKRKTGECFQWRVTGSCSRGESCSFLHKPASGNREIVQEKSGECKRIWP